MMWFLRKWWSFRSWSRATVWGVKRRIALVGFKIRESSQERRARSMFGERFVGMPEIRTYFADKLLLPPQVPIPFTIEELEARRESHWLVLDPGTAIKTLVEITGEQEGWERNKMEPFFFRAEHPTWRLVRMQPPREAVGLRSWKEQVAAATHLNEEVMEVRTLVVVGTILLWSRNVHIFLGQARTKSVFQARRAFVDGRVWLTKRKGGSEYVLGNPFPVGGAYHASYLEKDESVSREAGVTLEYVGANKL